MTLWEQIRALHLECKIKPPKLIPLSANENEFKAANQQKIHFEGTCPPKVAFGPDKRHRVREIFYVSQKNNRMSNLIGASFIQKVSKHIDFHNLTITLQNGPPIKLKPVNEKIYPYFSTIFPA